MDDPEQENLGDRSITIGDRSTLTNKKRCPWGTSRVLASPARIFIHEARPGQNLRSPRGGKVLSVSVHRSFPFPEADRIMSRMPALIASGRSSHALMTSAR